MPELDYPDGLMYIYFNTRGTKGGSPEIRKMLDYLQKSTAENVTGETLQKIHQHVVKVKEQPEVREEYMLLEEKMYYERKAAAKDGVLPVKRTMKNNKFFSVSRYTAGGIFMLPVM